jgi:hypothetical protein
MNGQKELMKSKRKPLVIYATPEFESSLKAALDKTQWTDKMSIFLRILVNLGLQEAEYRENNGISFLLDKLPPLSSNVIPFPTCNEQLSYGYRSKQ